MAKHVRRLARVAAKVEHVEDEQAREIVRSQAVARIQQLLPPEDQTQGRAAPRSMLPALLIINSKSGPAHDSLLRVRELVDLLAAHGIAADVRVKLHKSQARREARAAAKAGYPLVLAAGGDGTVSAVARGLVSSQTVLGVIPLGTYNNVATSLGIPVDVEQACALIAAAPVRAVDVGEVRARGMKRSRVFLEVGAVGIAAPLVVAGQGFEKGRWESVARHLPHAIDMAPAVLGVRLDGEGAVHRAQSMLALVANTPRGAPVWSWRPMPGLTMVCWTCACTRRCLSRRSPPTFWRSRRAPSHQTHAFAARPAARCASPARSPCRWSSIRRSLAVRRPVFGSELEGCWSSPGVATRCRVQPRNRWSQRSRTIATWHGPERTTTRRRQPAQWPPRRRGPWACNWPDAADRWALPWQPAWRSR